MEAMKPDELDDATLSAAYKALETQSPHAALDASILAAARAAVQPGATVLPFPAKRRRNWSLPLGLAASLTLAVGLSWQLQQSGEVRLDMPAAPAMQAEVAPAPTADKPDTKASAAPITPPAEQSPQPAPPVASAPALKQTLSSSTDTIAPKAADEESTQATRAMGAPAPSAPPPAPPAPIAMPAPATIAALPVDPPAPKAEPYADKPREKIGVTGSAIIRPDQAETAAPAADARRQEEGRLLKRSNLAAAPVGKLAMDPEQTIKEIRRLLTAHQEPAARALLKQLREQWPDHPLPPDLIELGKPATEPAKTAP